MYAVAAKAASRAASASGVPPAARPDIFSDATGIPAYRAARPRGPRVSGDGPTLPFGARTALPRATVSSQLPALPGRSLSARRSGTRTETAGGKPRAAIAAGASTTRSIHNERRLLVASRSVVSHQNGASGA